MSFIPNNITVKPNSVALVGWEEGGAGQIHAWLERTTDYHIACFVHPDDEPPVVDIAADRAKRQARRFDYPQGNTFKGLPLLSSSDWAGSLGALGITKALITVGVNSQRLKLIEQARSAGLTLINAIHPSALIMDDALLQDNVTIHARAIIGYRAEVHTGAIINTAAQLDHHDVIFPGALIAPGAILAGNVTVETCATVWAGAVIKHNLRIGAHAIVGAGSVVLKDIPPHVTAVGAPARILEKPVRTL